MKSIFVSIIIVGILISGAIIFSRSSSSSSEVVSVNNVSIVNGKQVVEIGVRGGYTPQISGAKADMPTVLRMKTNGTFDCSSGVVIPSLSLRKILSSSGETDISVPPQKAGTTLQGLCLMGMYRFQVQFN